MKAAGFVRLTKDRLYRSFYVRKKAVESDNVTIPFMENKKEISIYSYKAVLDSNKQIKMEPKDIYKVKNSGICVNPADVWKFAVNGLKMDKLADEYVYVLCLDVKYRLKAVFEAGHAGEASCAVPVRETFRKALLLGASCITLIHNHPSGAPAPSKADRDLTERFINTGKILSVPIADHVIIGDRRYYSFAMNWDKSHPGDNLPGPLLKPQYMKKAPVGNMNKPNNTPVKETPCMLWAHINLVLKASELPVVMDSDRLKWYGEKFASDDDFLSITAPADDGKAGVVSWRMRGSSLYAPYKTYERFATLMDWFMEEAGLA